MALEAVSSSLPVLALLNDIVFPASQVTISVPRSFASYLSRIVKNEDGQPPLVAASPALNSGPNLQYQDVQLSEWACAARIVRFVRPTPLSPNSCIVTLAGVARVQLEKPLPSPSRLHTLPLHVVHYPAPSTGKSISEPAAETFRSAASRLVDQLDAESRARRGRAGTVEWKRLKAIIEDSEAEKTPWVADILMAVITTIPWQDRIQMLSTLSPSDRLKLATSLLSKQASIAEVSHKISSAVDENLTKQQKEYYLRQQLQAIQRELAELNRPGAKSKTGAVGSSKSENDSTSAEFDEEGDETEYFADLRSKIEKMAVGSEERKMGVKEYRRLKRIPAGSVEQGVIRTYLEWLTSLPWPESENDKETQSLAVLQDPKFLAKAREQLDSDHFGLDTIKRRLIEYLAVLRLKALKQAEEANRASESTIVASGEAPRTSATDPQPKETVVKKHPVIRTKGPILLLVGPPGSGKTSVASSLAKALNRPFHRISLGGVRDEAEIRGHRRTYVASGPGTIVTAMSKVQRPDPVILLDEIDKVGHASHQGDPASALLEVLDPEQNVSFKDHYINVPLDLSQVIFIATANSLESISEPLLDRCEVIRLSGYTYDEKIQIARKFLLPKQLEANGLSADRLTITEKAYEHIASYYTREAGVRSLERAIGSIARWKAVEWSNFSQQNRAKGERDYNPVVDVDDLEPILGVPRWDPQEREREERKGLVYGLVVSGQGEGAVLPVETIMTSGSGKLRLTGSLGEVIRESGEIALSWVKAHAYTLGITNSETQDLMKEPHPIDIHLHLPSGAVKKDGPSAGVALVCAFVSLLTGLTVSKYIAMTGETTLRGRVTAVGGIKEKVLGAHREGICKVILPRSNRKDVEHDVPAEIMSKMEFVYVSRVEEALEAAFGPGVLNSGHRLAGQVESRL
ncbi:Lon protease homolog 2, peroxisomal {ECO:0000255/HAMAP-Rule:MF_03121} {ECO:0000255/HAMAP-Rule:MF_03121} [Serendipita indica DSM 11827]|uniref:Lon protease homolog n=1 Tax=Serendipita indica (strain DSM 11827) TaxID=1109443 RepID=G4T544_SERID|nr:Lon protease homolog 2, peroxisomal {ECO:0000255/HAMAP-Rule:MF_03121} {ECO:0000255/HAMAP-Rule:MF_03121} [Serendipita indica DSM 11827]CCA66437.1 related to ATP-dependent protease La [Serendipita indica DSM 11827]